MPRVVVDVDLELAVGHDIGHGVDRITHLTRVGDADRVGQADGADAHVVDALGEVDHLLDRRMPSNGQPNDVASATQMFICG